MIRQTNNTFETLDLEALANVEGGDGFHGCDEFFR